MPTRLYERLKKMQLKDIWREATKFLPPRVRYLLNATLNTLRRYPEDVLFWVRQPAKKRMAPMPPPFLRYRVAGHYRIKQFHEGGLQSRQDFESALNSVGRNLADFHCILDFGVGCSRIMRWMEDVSATAELYGADIDVPAIRWSKRHIPYAEFSANQPLPPLDYPDEKFELVYSHSVFTHLDEHYQDRWLAELKRVTKPGAVLLLTVHGDVPWKQFVDSAPDHPAMARHIAAYERQGFLFFKDDEWTGVFPAFYHSMFHQKAYVMKHWSKYFDILNYVDAGMLSFQDIVVLQKPL
jgi:SAM-dependent methyltransferase